MIDDKERYFISTMQSVNDHHSYIYFDLYFKDIVVAISHVSDRLCNDNLVIICFNIDNYLNNPGYLQKKYISRILNKERWNAFASML